jgi:radical SAM protein with 4Fe4S-binding SPASM domain
VVFEPVFGSSEQSATANLPLEEIGERLASYYVLAESLGYDVTFSNTSIRPGRLVYCYAERENQLIVGPTGDLFKCSVSRFEERDRVGYLSDDGRLVKDEVRWHSWVERPISFEKACVDCVFLPLCMGGCRKLRMAAESGNRCSLAPTNASYILKQLALGRLEQTVRSMVEVTANVK